MVKDFTNELTDFNNRLKYREPFTISRFNDGELSIINNKPYKASRHHGTREFIFAPGQKHIEFQKLLRAAYTYDHPTYYTGIVCPCCATLEEHLTAKETISRPVDKLTWANIFVNSNYKKFIESTVPLLCTYKRVVLVCNEISTPSGLPFHSNIYKIVHIPTTAWLSGDIINELLEHVTSSPSGELYIFAAGPLANVLAMMCNEMNPDNTYIDIGSTLDSYLGLGRTRGYHKRNNKFNSRVCYWAD